MPVREQNRSRALRVWSTVGRLAVLAICAFSPALAAADDGSTACRRAGLDAERKWDIPTGLLQAIGLVESGRRDPASGRTEPWPWTINANGTGQMFADRPEALAATRAALGRGVASIDVGCFQINLLHHPTAFASLEEAFDPQANATYAARFLTALRARTGNWENAIAAYHSATPERGFPYRDKVMARLAPGRDLPASAASRIDPVRVWRVMEWAPAPATGRVNIWSPSASGLAPSIIRIASKAASRKSSVKITGPSQ